MNTPRPPFTTQTAGSTATCKVSVVIKALNEEAHIGPAIESALRAVQRMGGEVVLADSCSTDRTVEIASAYPIRIVQLADPGERCCGIGPQLGFQHSLGEYVYLMDGDMQLQPGFLERAVGFLAQHPEVAGVAGRVLERNLESLEYRERAVRIHPHSRPGPVDRLDGGGLYRRLAIQEAGYFSDRNLHSYEEFDLAVRLRSRGWKLWRLPVDAVSHYGHAVPHYELLLRRWRSGYICGLGELVRSAIGQPWLRLVWRDQRELRLYSAVWVWWALAASTLAWPMSWPLRFAAFLALVAFPWVGMSVRKRSVERGVYSVTSWCFNALGLLRGMLRPRRPAHEPIRSRVLREPSEGITPDRPGSVAAAVPPLRPFPPSAQRSGS